MFLVLFNEVICEAGLDCALGVRGNNGWVVVNRWGDKTCAFVTVQKRRPRIRTVSVERYIKGRLWRTF